MNKNDAYIAELSREIRETAKVTGLSLQATLNAINAAMRARREGKPEAEIEKVIDVFLDGNAP